MSIFSLIAIYLLFWVFSAILVLPFGVRTHDEAGVAKVPGQADSAPAEFRPRLVLLRATLLATALCGLYYANFVNGWITADDVNPFPPAPRYDGSSAS